LESETRVPIDVCPKVGHQSTADEAARVSGVDALESRKSVVMMRAKK
jgi:hypothetical protein